MATLGQLGCRPCLRASACSKKQPHPRPRAATAFCQFWKPAKGRTPSGIFVGQVVEESSSCRRLRSRRASAMGRKQTSGVSAQKCCPTGTDLGLAEMAFIDHGAAKSNKVEEVEGPPFSSILLPLRNANAYPATGSRSTAEQVDASRLAAGMTARGIRTHEDWNGPEEGRCRAKKCREEHRLKQIAVLAAPRRARRRRDRRNRHPDPHRCWRRQGRTGRHPVLRDRRH